MLYIDALLLRQTIIAKSKWIVKANKEETWNRLHKYLIIGLPLFLGRESTYNACKIIFISKYNKSFNINKSSAFFLAVYFLSLYT